MRGGARPGAGRKAGVKTSPPSKAINIRLPLETAEAIEKLADREHITVSAWVKKAIIKRMEENMDKMLMNPVTGSVAPESEWRQDFADVAPEDRIDVWGGPRFENGGLIEVVPNIEGQPGYDPHYGDWREA